MRKTEQIENLIELYGNQHSEEIFMLQRQNRGNGDPIKARCYLEKFFLSDEDYLQNWLSIQEQIFSKEIVDLNKVFNPSYKKIELLGGVLFEENDFEQLKSCALSLGDKYLLVVESTLNGKCPTLKFKFPSSITWEEINDGDFISTHLLEVYIDEYYVFSESGLWGKYAANDHWPPVDIIGFLPEYKPLFTEAFSSIEGYREI